MHEIRLRTPWQRCREDGSDCARVDVPETGHPPVADPGVFCYSRSFNLPSGLQPSSRVYLRIDRWEGRLEAVTVNGVALNVEHSNCNADITKLLRPHNEIALRLAGLPGQAARLSGEVRLVIDDSNP